MSLLVEELVQVDPGSLVIGRNVRVDTLPDAREFAASIKARGVVEVITAYRDGDGQLVVLRGQRRAVVAAQVGPTGTVTVRVVAAPAEADRITDQMTENLHRAGMADAEVRDGIEQLALCGISAAQIAKRTAITRSTVDAALVVAAHPATRSRMDTDGLTLDQAAIFAEFDDDPAAVEELTLALQWRRPLEHTAQRLRDTAAEYAAIRAEAARLRDAGVPALDPADTPHKVRVLRFDTLVTNDGQPVAETDWPTVRGAAVAVVQEWRYPDTDHADSDRANDDDADPDGADGNLEVVSDPVSVLVPVWICTDPAAAGLRYRYDYLAGRGPSPTDSSPDPATREAEKDAQRVERRLVIDNNKAWRSAETVRREWLARFCSRKTPPAGAEALICEAVATGQYTLTRAMQEGHRLLTRLLHPEHAADALHSRVTARQTFEPVTGKAATMRTLACLIAAWEESTSTQTWRNPSPWDTRIMTALTEWGYIPSNVETLLTQPTADLHATGPADDNHDTPTGGTTA